jgi:hypothetical protein
MKQYTSVLLVIALILIIINIFIDMQQADQLVFNQRDNFSPISPSFSSTEPIFQPDGYDSMSQYSGLKFMPLMHRNIS